MHLQKPGLRFAASRLDWWERFERTVKEGARPLLILWPFAPVALVYEVEDTEGPPLPPDIAQAFRATGEMTESRMLGLIDRLAKHGIETLQIEYGDGMAGSIVRPSETTEIIRQSRKSKDLKSAKEKPHYRIRLNKAHNPNVRFATLIHELAHLFLGHLGTDVYLKIPDRHCPSHRYREIEAESVCYIVCRRNGVEPDSYRYLADYVHQQMAEEHFDLYALFKAAGQIETLLDLAAHSRF